MADPVNVNPLALELLRTRDKLVASESDFERVQSEYSKLESIARKQLKMRLSTLPSDQASEKSDIQSISSINSKCKAKRSSSITSKQSDSNSSRRYCSIASRTSESTKSIPKATDSKEAAEQVINSQLIKRITQFHENVESLEGLYEKPVPEKSRFLKHLQRLNNAAWKTQKGKNPALQKLEKFLK